MATRSGNEEDTRRDAAARGDAATGATLLAAADPRQLSTSDTLVAAGDDPRGPIGPARLSTSDTLIAPDADAASAPVSGIAATAFASAGEAATFIAGARAPRTPSRGSARGRGATLGRYLILERLGAGGMGEVYAAYDPELDRKVAIKLLRRELSGAGTSGSSRLLREAQSMARLSHPNVVAIHDVGTVDDQVFLAMELIEGETMSAWLERASPAWPRVVQVMIAAGRGLAAAHDAGLIHRDFKPDNVLIGRDGRVRVSDFGLARSGQQEELYSAADLTAAGAPLGGASIGSLTVPGSVLGTPAYMAPEQHRGEDADVRSDIYAFAASLYEGLSGRLPFTGDNLGELVYAVLHASPAPLPRALPGDLTALVLRGLERDPERRYPTMHALLAELAVDPRRRRRRRLFAAGSLALALAVGGGLWSQRAAQERRCAAEAAAIDAVWNAGIKATIDASVRAIDRPFVVDASARLLDLGDDYAAAWRAQAGDLCRDAVIDGDLEEAEYSAARRCLDHARVRFADVTELLRDADQEIVVQAIDALLRLPPPSDCADLRSATLAYGGDAFEDPQRRAAIEGVRDDLGRASAQVLSGRFDDAAATAEGVVAAARDLGFAPLLAEAELLLGDAAARLDRDDAGAHLHAGLAAAIAADYDRAAGDASLALAALHIDEGEHDAAERWLSLAAAWIRDDAAVASRVELLTQRASLARSRGRFADADALLGEALALAEPLGRWSPQLLDLKVARAALHTETFDFAQIEAAGNDALALARDRYGPEHPSVGKALTALAIAAEKRDDLERSRALHERALEILRRAYGDEHPAVARGLANLAILDNREERWEEGLERANRARALAIAAYDEDHPLVARIDNNIGTILKELHRDDEALAVLTRALESRRRREASGTYVPTMNLAMTYYEIGNRHRCKGREAEGIAALKKAADYGRDALEGALADVGPRHLHTAIVHNALGLTLAGVEDYRGSLAAHRRALALLEGLIGPEASEAGFSLLGIGRALHHLNDDDGALAALDRALALPKLEGAGLREELRFERAKVLWELGQREPAVAIARELAAATDGDSDCLGILVWLRERGG